MIQMIEVVVCPKYEPFPFSASSVVTSSLLAVRGVCLSCVATGHQDRHGVEVGYGRREGLRWGGAGRR